MRELSYQPEIGIRKLSAEESATEIKKGMWNFHAINLQKAHETTRGEGVNIAVIDCGVKKDHPDIAGSYKGGKDTVSGDPGVDEEGHGTFVAGIIAGKKTGVAPDSSIYSVKVFKQKEGDYPALKAGIMWCLNNPEDVHIDLINMSLGSPEYWDELEGVCELAYQKGVPIIAAAGNNYSGAFFPATHKNVISVTAVQNLGDSIDSLVLNHCEYSNFWPSANVCAPGETVLSLCFEGGYCQGGGTSAAAPHVTGVLALGISLLKRQGKEVSIKELTKAILKTTRKLDDFGEAERLAKGYDPKRAILNGRRKMRRCLFGEGLVQADKFIEWFL